MLTPDTPAVAPETTSLDESTGSPTISLYRAAIGPINLDYYLRVFTRFEATGRGGPSWNWSAFLCTLNWMMFRGLWGPALVYAAAVLCAPVLIFGIGGPLLHFPNVVEMTVWAAFGAICFVVPGVYGNALLYAASRKKMEHALTSSKTLEEACVALNHQASSRRRLVWLILGNYLLGCAVVGAYMVFPGIVASVRGASPTQAAQQSAGGPVDKPIPIQVPALASSSLPAAIQTTPASSSPASASSISAPAAPASTSSPTPAVSAAVPCKNCQNEVTASKPKDSIPAVASAASAVAAPQFYINVGLFAKDANARNAHAKLIDAGLISFREAVKSRKGTLTRVRVGPFDTQAQADAAAEKIHTLKLDAIVIQK